MGELARMLLQWIEFLWPLRIVRAWERAGYYICGRYWRDVGPGIYPVIPWFTEIHEVSVVPAIVGTARLDITLSDGSTLSFRASARCRVVSFDLAVNKIDSFVETTEELIASVLAERLAQVDAARVAPDKRGRLLSDLQRWINEESLEFGVEVSRLRFTTFITNVRTLRFLQDGGAMSW